LGLPAFGRTFGLMDKKKSGLSAKSFNNGTSGNFTKTPGFLSFYEICELKKQPQWKNVWITQSKSSYMHRNNDWVSYDDIKSFHLIVCLTILIPEINLLPKILNLIDCLCCRKKIRRYIYLVNRHG
jgi:hypothetical protein